MASFDDKAEEFREFYAEHFAKLQGAAEAFRGLLELLLSDRNEFAAPVVTCRLKDPDECVAKFKRKYLATIEESEEDYAIRDLITDLIGVRAVALYVDEIEAIRAVVADEFDVVEVTDKTATLEETEGTFGYKGLHMDLRLDEQRSSLPEYKHAAGWCFELQIRTIIQDGWSSLDHQIKYKKKIPHDLRRRINSLAALFEIADREFREIRELTQELVKDAGATEMDDSFGAALNAFTLQAVATKLFPGYQFWPDRLDAFAQELTEMNAELNPSALEHAYTENRELLEAYGLFQQKTKRHRPNPFTMMRHALHLLDSSRHERILRKSQRLAFEDWQTNRDELG